MASISDLIRNPVASGVQIQSSLLQAAMEKSIKERQDRALNAVAAVFEGFAATVESSVAHLREIRKMEKKQKDLVTELDRAFKFLCETGNPFPFYKLSNACSRSVKDFCTKAGIDMPEADNECWKVPEDWKGPAAEVAEVAQS